MKATIFHNPMCGTSRKTLHILRGSGCDVWVREYLKNPPTRDELKDLYSAEGQILKALPRMIKAASHRELKRALTEHERITRKQVQRLEPGPCQQ